MNRAALWLRRLLMLAAGTVVSQAGIQLFVAVRLGSDPYMVFIQGVAHVSGLSNGMAMNLVMIALMALLLVFTRGYVRPGTVLCTFCVGPLVGMYERLYGALLPDSLSLAAKGGLLLLACIIAALGLAIMLQSAAGACPNDLISVVLADKLPRLEFRFARIGTDAVLVIAGFLLGGTVGVGTVVSVCLYGPVIQFFTPLAQKLARALRVHGAAETPPDERGDLT